MFSCDEAGPLLVPPFPRPVFLVPAAPPFAVWFRPMHGVSLVLPPPRPPAIGFYMRPFPRQCRENGIQVRSVWASNLKQEIALIRSLLPRYPIAAVDTEFPGTVHDSGKPRHLRSTEERYALVKKNVDELHLIQLGLTLCDADGGLPDLGTGGAVRYIWEFNFRDFDVRADAHAADSIALLKKQGLDFNMLRVFGIDSCVFAAEFFSSGLRAASQELTWITFSGSYDLAYMLKMLGGGQPLPERLEDFLARVEELFGNEVFDVKHMAKFCGDRGIHGGLEHVASVLDVPRVAGEAHNAGSDSLLTCHVFLEIVGSFFGYDTESYMRAIDGFV